jgi:hypothetical protein
VSKEDAQRIAKGENIMAKNVKVSVDEKAKTLTVVLDLSQDHGPSSSGKTNIVGTTEGNIEIPGFPGYKLGVNCFKPKA